MQVDYFCLIEQDAVWHAIDKLAQEVGYRGGVYRIHAFRDDAPPAWHPASVTPISRVLGDDPLGRLYIGKADVFTDRFITLRKALHPEFRSRDGHGFARAYLSSEAYQKRFPRLCFTLRFDDNPLSAESAELAQCRSEFGECPPFNAMS